MNENQKQLAKLLETMDVPAGRKQDIPWLARNLAVRNGNHPQFQQAIGLIKELSRAGIS